MADFDLSGLAGLLQNLPQRIARLKAEAASTEVSGEAGGGLVKVVANGRPEILSVDISAAAFEDRELLEDLVKAAANDALRKAGIAAAAKVAELTAGLPIPPGLL